MRFAKIPLAGIQGAREGREGKTDARRNARCVRLALNAERKEEGKQPATPSLNGSSPDGRRAGQVGDQVAVLRGRDASAGEHEDRGDETRAH
jgi:hypothetical protein